MLGRARRFRVGTVAGLQPVIGVIEALDLAVRTSLTLLGLLTATPPTDPPPTDTTSTPPRT
jgi:hypothetical protein